MNTDPIAGVVGGLIQNGECKQLTLEVPEAAPGGTEATELESPAQPLASRWYRSFGGTFLCTIVATLCCYFLVVTIVNPRGVFWGRSFPQILPNSRGLKLGLLENYARGGPVDLVVLGSSRSMRLSPDVLESLTGQRAFNAGVFRGAPNDYLSLYRVMKQRKILPKTLVLGLDQDSLDGANGTTVDFDSNLELTSALDGAVPDLPEKLWHWIRLYKQTLTPYYIQNIAKSVWVRVIPRPALFEFETNGHEEERVFDREIQSGAYPQAEKIKTCEDMLVAEFSRFHDFSPGLEQDLKQLLSEATRDRIRVVLWITPLDPHTLGSLLNDGAAGGNFRNAQAHLAEIAAMYGLPVRDFTDSRGLAADPNSWYDCVHYNQTVSDRIARELFPHGL